MSSGFDSGGPGMMKIWKAKAIMPRMAVFAFPQTFVIQFAGAAIIICGCALVLGLFQRKEPDIHG